MFIDIEFYMEPDRNTQYINSVDHTQIPQLHSHFSKISIKKKWSFTNDTVMLVLVISNYVYGVGA